MEEKKKVTEAHIRATEKWEKENYDKVKQINGGEKHAIF